MVIDIQLCIHNKVYKTCVNERVEMWHTEKSKDENAALQDRLIFQFANKV